VAPDLDIRLATHRDLPDLVRVLDQERFFADRFARQQTGHGELLVARQKGTPVGVVYLWLAPAEEPELRQHLPGVPLLNHLEVAAGHRNQGIGTAIIGHAEARVRAAGRRAIALGIRLDNVDAARLYKRLGYVEWEHGELATHYVVFLADGGEDRHPEMCRILVKDLPATSSLK
jgi:ribosomal protein S18 acetylase RimI-like enzyme